MRRGPHELSDKQSEDLIQHKEVHLREGIEAVILVQI